MSKSIQISPKHGVNPTIPICFWCGREKNEIVLMGRIRKKDPVTGKAVRGSDIEAPMRACLNSEPCEECQKVFSQGVLVVEVVDYDNGLFPVYDTDGEAHWLTGRHAVMNDPNNKGGKCLATVETMNEILSRCSA